MISKTLQAIIISLTLISCNSNNNKKGSIDSPFIVEYKSKNYEDRLPEELREEIMSYENDVLDYLERLVLVMPADGTEMIIEMNEGENSIDKGDNFKGLFSITKGMSKGMYSYFTNSATNNIPGLGFREVKKDILRRSESMNNDVNKIIKTELEAIDYASKFASRYKNFRLNISSEDNIDDMHVSTADSNMPTSLTYSRNNGLLKHSVILDFINSVERCKQDNYKNIFLMRYYLAKYKRNQKDIFLDYCKEILSSPDKEPNTGNEDLDKTIERLKECIADLSNPPAEVSKFLKFSAENLNSKFKKYKKLSENDIYNFFSSTLKK